MHAFTTFRLRLNDAQLAGLQGCVCSSMKNAGSPPCSTRNLQRQNAGAPEARSLQCAAEATAVSKVGTCHSLATCATCCRCWSPTTNRMEFARLRLNRLSCAALFCTVQERKSRPPPHPLHSPHSPPNHQKHDCTPFNSWLPAAKKPYF